MRIADETSEAACGEPRPVTTSPFGLVMLQLLLDLRLHSVSRNVMPEKLMSVQLSIVRTVSSVP